ncbi:MAG: hypothetical protein ACI4UJ_03340 [Candidatus Cryptobacteroides sp.]
MRRIILTLAMLVLCMTAFAQAQITTKKEKVSDFMVRTMKVALTGNDFIDSPFKEAVKNTWTLSPFEFCTIDDFNNMMGREDLYFLVPTKVKYKSEARPGTMMLTLYKGRSGAKDTSKLLEVASIPLCSAESPSGREAAMMPGIMDVLQSYVAKSLASRFSPISSSVRKKPSGCKVYFAESEVSPAISPETVAKLRDKGALIENDAVADSIFIEGEAGTAVSYLISPAFPEKGSVCWKMIINSRTHELHYLKKEVLKNENPGFSKGEISKFK